jgi:hypothetical protein
MELVKKAAAVFNCRLLTSIGYLQIPASRQPRAVYGLD